MHFITESAIYKWANQLWNKPPAGNPEIQNFPVDNLFSSWRFWSRRPYPDFASRAKDQSLKVLTRILKLCDKNNIKLAIVTIPTKEQVYSKLISGNNFDIRLPQKYVADFAASNSVPYLDLLPPLRTNVQKTGKRLYLEPDSHLNEEGHRLVGHIVADFFAKQLLHSKS